MSKLYCTLKKIAHNVQWRPSLTKHVHLLKKSQTSLKLQQQNSNRGHQAQHYEFFFAYQFQRRFQIENVI